MPDLSPLFANLHPFSPTLRAAALEPLRQAAESEIALQRLFLFLRDKGLPLTVRDYQDALSAMQAGYGLHRRDRLLWLCQTLWARGEDEVRLLELLFKAFPEPTPAEVTGLTGPATGRTREQPGAVSSPGSKSPTVVDEPAETLPLPGMQFVGPGQRDGFGLPRAQVAPEPGETFILTERPIIPLRNLIIIWRRFRRPLRTGPKIELDIEATVAARCRQGLLERPVLVPTRRNLARLVLLIDVGERMQPWQRFNSPLVESLQQSRLEQIAIFYSYDLSSDTLYRRENLTQPVPLEKAWRDHVSSSLLIFSEAGATQPGRQRAIVRDTRHFLQRVGSAWSPVAWVNPMPARRWPGSAAAQIRQLPAVAMFELSEDGLINAVDILRGK